jgi:hypothetical protein
MKIAWTAVTWQMRRHTLVEWQTMRRKQNQNKPRGVVLAAVAAIVRVDTQKLKNQQVQVKASGERTQRKFIGLQGLAR